MHVNHVQLVIEYIYNNVYDYRSMDFVNDVFLVLLEDIFQNVHRYIQQSVCMNRLKQKKKENMIE